MNILNKDSFHFKDICIVIDNGEQEDGRGRRRKYWLKFTLRY